MQEQKLLYIVGGFTEFGFRTYDAYSVFTDYDDAKHCLKKALLNSYSGNGWKIYKVHSSHFIPTEKENDDGLHNFNIIKSIMIDKGITGACKWFDNDEFREFGDVYVQFYWSYDLKKRTATLKIDYSLYNYDYNRMPEAMRERYHNKIDKDIYNRVHYLFIPELKKIMKEHDMDDIRVEFKNKFTGRKINKGFITKE